MRGRWPITRTLGDSVMSAKRESGEHRRTSDRRRVDMPSIEQASIINPSNSGGEIDQAFEGKCHRKAPAACNRLRADKEAGNYLV